MSTVWIVMAEDGNVCCPGEEVEAVFLSKDEADRYVSRCDEKEKLLSYFHQKSRSVNEWVIGADS